MNPERPEPVYLAAGAQVPAERGLDLLQQVLRLTRGGHQQGDRARKCLGEQVSIHLAVGVAFCHWRLWWWWQRTMIVLRS